MDILLEGVFWHEQSVCTVAHSVLFLILVFWFCEFLIFYCLLLIIYLMFTRFCNNISKGNTLPGNIYWNLKKKRFGSLLSGWYVQGWPKKITHDKNHHKISSVTPNDLKICTRLQKIVTKVFQFISANLIKLKFCNAMFSKTPVFKSRPTSHEIDIITFSGDNQSITGN